MMGNYKTTFRFFTIMQHEQEAEYLGRMHREGWKFAGIDFPGFYHFVRSVPEDVVYQLDYNQDGLAHKSEYIQMFADCGWEYLMDFFGYSYFRKPRALMQGDEEIFCDDESRLEMMKRVRKGRILPMVIVFFFCIVPQFLLHAIGFGGGSPVQRGWSVTLLVCFFIYVFIFLLFSIKYYQYERNIRKDKNGILLKYIGFFSFILILSAIVISVFVVSNRDRGRASKYTLQEHESGFSIGAEYLNGAVTQRQELHKGDIINGSLVLTEGNLQIEIGCENEAPVFTEYVEKMGSFNYEIEKDGNYVITCTGENAEGSFYFEIQ